MASSELPPLMPLDFALQRHFPHGGVSKAIMIAAIHRGDLGAVKIGRAYFVTDDDVNAWRQKCRTEAKSATPAGQQRPHLLPDGSLSMEERKASLAAAYATLEAIKPRKKDRKLSGK